MSALRERARSAAKKISRSDLPGVKCQIEVRTKRGGTPQTESVDAVRYGEWWAVHRAVTEPGWTVTLIPTGLCAGVFSSRGIATHVARQFCAAPDAEVRALSKSLRRKRGKHSPRVKRLLAVLHVIARAAENRDGLGTELVTWEDAVARAHGGKL